MAKQRKAALAGRRVDGRVRAICARLKRTYGLPRHGNPTDPLDDLIYVVLSNRSTAAAVDRVFSTLRNAYPSWDALADVDESDLYQIIRPLGFGRLRSAQIITLLREIRCRLGSCDLRPLAALPSDRTEAFLTSLAGVSTKVAKCVMMYTLNHSVLPVDVHVHRIARRLGWVKAKRPDQTYESLEAIVPKALRYTFHVGCISHGRLICRGAEPKCDECVLSSVCPSSKPTRRRRK